MRHIGNIPTESQARVFRSYLISIGIKNDVDQTRNGDWAVWIHDEGQLGSGKQELDQFLDNPKDARYQQLAKAGVKQEQQENKENEKFRTNVVDMRTKFGTQKVATATVTLIFISIVTYIFQNVGDSGRIQEWFSIAKIVPVEEGLLINRTFSDIEKGQLWRLVTPVFLHFSILHILFNMTWMFQLGSVIENKEGKRFYIFFFLGAAIISNIIQFVMNFDPRFGGMSGVVYALFGYFWIMGKYKDRETYYLEQSTIVILIGWFFLCMTGWVGNIANGAHAGGFIVGIVVAAIKSRVIPFTRIRF